MYKFVTSPRCRYLFYGALPLLLSLAAPPAEAFRCGQRLVDRGDFASEVLNKCGEPEQVVERTEYRSYREYDRILDAFREWSEPVRIEEWLYNFGPRRFKRLLYFENGRLEHIETLDYGH